MNKKGILRIVEAVIAIMIVFGALLVIASQKATKVEGDLSTIIPPLLEEIALNTQLREKIVQAGESETGVTIDSAETDLNDFLSEKITNPALGYQARICTPPDSACPIADGGDSFDYSSVDGDIYAEDRILTSTLDLYAPKRLKIFIWRNKQ